MAEYTYPVGLRTIVSGTTISLHTLGASVCEPSFPWTSSKDCGIDVLSLAISSILRQRYKLPTQCVRLIWNHPVMGTRRELTVDVTFIMVPIRLDSLPRRTYASKRHRHRLLTDSPDHCFVCEGPCRDADDDDSRGENCVRCFPPFLCRDCTVDIGGKNCCYNCLEGGETGLVPKQIRLQLLVPWKFE